MGVTCSEVHEWRERQRACNYLPQSHWMGWPLAWMVFTLASWIENTTTSIDIPLKIGTHCFLSCLSFSEDRLLGCVWTVISVCALNSSLLKRRLSSVLIREADLQCDISPEGLKWNPLRLMKKRGRYIHCFVWVSWPSEQNVISWQHTQ